MNLGREEASPVFTIFGASGFVDSHLMTDLRRKGNRCWSFGRTDANFEGQHLGNVIFCAGVTSDFRNRPYDTVEAHVSLVNKILREERFDSFTYLSSTRIYIHSNSTAESSKIVVDVEAPEDLFNISKLMGESICLHSGRRNVKIVRLSNVLGSDFASSNFVFSLIKDAVEKAKIVLHTTLDSAKDYVHIADVIDMLPKIAVNGESQIYNLASGENHTNAEIVARIGESVVCGVEVDPGARQIQFEHINIERLKSEFGFVPRPILPLVSELAAEYALSI